MPLKFQPRFFSKIQVSFRSLWKNLMSLSNSSSGVSVSKANVSWNVEFRNLDINKFQPKSSSNVGLPVRTWLVLHLVLREMLYESDFCLYNAWIVFTFRESLFLLFWKKHLTIITKSLNFLLIPPHLRLSKVVKALMFSAHRCSKCWFRFSASCFFSLSWRTSTLYVVSQSLIESSLNAYWFLHSSSVCHF